MESAFELGKGRGVNNVIREGIPEVDRAVSEAKSSAVSSWSQAGAEFILVTSQICCCCHIKIAMNRDVD